MSGPVRLFLLRHAHAEAGRGDDHARDLTAHGREAAAAVGRAMLDRGALPVRALVSSALRARRTFEGLVEAWTRAPTVDVLDTLYLAPADRLLESALDAGAASVLIVAHNPGIGELARRLTESAAGAIRVTGYPPAALTQLRYEDGGWVAEGYWPTPGD